MMMITSESRRCWQEHDREPSRRHCQSRRRTRACTVSTACVAAAGVAESVTDVYLAPFPTLVPPLAMCASPHPTTSPIALPRSKTELPTPTSSPLGLLLPPAPSLSLSSLSTVSLSAIDNNCGSDYQQERNLILEPIQ